MGTGIGSTNLACLESERRLGGDLKVIEHTGCRVLFRA